MGIRNLFTKQMQTKSCSACCRNFANDPDEIVHPPDISFLTKSVEFDGINDYAHVDPSPAALNPIDDFTIQCWIKPTIDCAMFARIIQTPATGVDGVLTAYSLGLGGNDNLHETNSNAFRLSFSVDDGVSEVVRFSSEPVIIPDIWTHVSAIWDDTSSEITLYVSGVSVNLYPGPPVAYAGITNPGLVVGWHSPADINYIWKGNLCSLAIIMRIITTVEAESLAIRTINLLEHQVKDDLESWWKLGDDDVFPTLEDSDSINHLTMVNMDAGDIVNDVPHVNYPSQHRDTHRELNVDPLPIQAGGVGYPLLYDHFIMASTGSLTIGSANWGSNFSTDSRQIRWHSERSHAGIITLDNFALTGAADEWASIVQGGPQGGGGTLWNHVIDSPEIVDPANGPLKMEWLVRFPKITAVELERGAMGFGDRFEVSAPLSHPVHDNGWYIEFDPSISSAFRLISTKTTGGTVTEVVTGTTTVVADRWYKLEAELRYEILTSAAVVYTPKMTLKINDVVEGSLTPITSLPDDTADLALGARYDAGSNAAPSTQDAGNNYKTPTTSRLDLDYVIITQIGGSYTHT